MDYETPVSVPFGYRCPLGGDHRGDRYFRWPLFEGPICDLCATELDYLIVAENRPNDFLIDRVEQVTGRPWSECRIVFLRDQLDYWETVQQKQPRDWVAAELQDLRQALRDAISEGHDP